MKPYRARFDRDDREKGRTYNPESRDNPNRTYGRGRDDDKKFGGRKPGGFRRKS